MKIILLITLFTLQLFALNPKVYAALGDKIYDNMDKIDALQYTREFRGYKTEIKEYVFDVKALKGIGYMIDKGNSQVTKKEYLQNLRKLSKTNDFFVESIKSAFHKSIRDEDSDLFRLTVTSGLIDTRRNKSKIKEYYYSHSDELDIAGTIIEEFVQEDIERQKRSKKKVYKGPTKEDIERAKIERIRAKDKAKQEAIAKALEEELKRKKQKIREEQKKELKTR